MLVLLVLLVVRGLLLLHYRHMAEIPKIVLPHGGYKKLIVYRKSDVVYEGTVTFCRRFLPAHGDRTVDQMIQAG